MMKDIFCECYSTVCPNPTNEQMNYRLEGINQYCARKEIDVLPLVMLFFGIHNDHTFEGDFADLFNTIDLSFSKNNHRELELLAGVALLKLLEDDLLVIEIVLAVNILNILDKNILIPDILQIATDKLAEITSDIREVEIESKLKKLPAIITTEMNKIAKSGDWTPEGITELMNSLNSIESGFVAIQSNQAELANSVRIYKEDSNILSWIVGGYSNDLRKPLSKTIKTNEIAFVMGKELADLIETVPGPYAAKGFIKKMLGLCKEDKGNLSLTDMIDLVGKEWREEVVNRYKIIDTGENTPVLLAISKSLETDEPKTWCPLFKKIVGVNPEEIERNALEWAYQFYLECLLIRCFNGVN